MQRNRSRQDRFKGEVVNGSRDGPLWWETSGAGVVNECRNLTIAMRLPCGCLADDRRPRFSAGPKSTQLAVSANLESTSLQHRSIVRVRLRTDGRSGPQSGWSGYRDTCSFAMSSY